MKPIDYQLAILRALNSEFYGLAAALETPYRRDYPAIVK